MDGEEEGEVTALSDTEVEINERRSVTFWDRRRTWDSTGVSGVAKSAVFCW